jgi:low temperature requirement protein LtrA
MICIATLFISHKWDSIGFKGTHIMQRMSLLSLIILGEGIIVICKAISKVVKNYYAFDATLAGQLVAAVVTICKFTPSARIHLRLTFRYRLCLHVVL